ncbi:MAG: glycosyltransferase [Candidatus Peregrinibacteria bacterium]
MSVSAVIHCHRDERIVNCIDDLRRNHGNHEVVAVLTETSQNVQRLIEGRKVKIAWAPVGNLSRSTNIGIAASTHDHIAILDSDVRCSDGYLDIVDRDLEKHMLIRTHMDFQHRNVLESLVAELRSYVYSKNVFYCPAIAFRKELKDHIGGYFFNDQVWWTEDAEIDHRIQKAGLPIHREPDAVVTHDPESISHDLRGAYKIGRGKFAQVLYANRDTFEEKVGNVLKHILSGESVVALLELARQKSVSTALYSVVWQTIYLLGYHRERIGHLLHTQNSGPFVMKD